ncbi:hypothetical protein BGZ49_005292 [Haplosporangium sp. Z 27]|nr:hypothetical protein BGZ49_005292 [Haplosporangium sp. Z 27]
MENITPPNGIMKLPPEILVRVASYIERASLPNACLVSKLWLACMRAELWREISPSSYLSRPFFEQFPLYYEHVRSISISIPCDTEDMIELLGVSAHIYVGEDGEEYDYSYNYLFGGNPEFKVEIMDDKNKKEEKEKEENNDGSDSEDMDDGDSPPRVSLKDCRRLESFEISFETDIKRIPIFESDLEIPFTQETEALIDAVETIMDNNKSTLCDLIVNGLIEEIQDRVFKLIKQMPLLNFLTLQAWESLCDLRLAEILQDKSHSIETLSLEMNDLVEHLWTLRLWREQWDDIQNFDDDKKLTTEQTQLKKIGLTKIRTLILDRSNIGVQSLLDLASVMPDLRSLSLKDTYGLGQDDEDFDSEDVSFSEDNSGNDDDDIEEDISGTTPPDLPPLIPAGPSPEPEISPIMSTSTNSSTNKNNANGEVQSSSSPNFGGSSGVPPITLDDDDEGWESYESSNPGSDGEGEWIPGDTLLAFGLSHKSVDNYRLLRKMRRLHAYCPLIQSFDFSECRPDQLDSEFFEFICDLWGPYNQLIAEDSLSNPSKPKTPKSPGLKELILENVCVVTPKFFEAIYRNCARTLTKLDLSLDPNIRWDDRQHKYEKEIEFKIYYDTILTIMKNCATLELLHAEPYPVNARMIVNGGQWACTRLTSLRISIEFDPTTVGVRGKAAAKEADRILRIKTCRKLAQLTRLEELRLEGGRMIVTTSRDPLRMLHKNRVFNENRRHKRSYLDLSLSTGLQELAPLKELRVLDVTHLGPHSLRESAEVEWIGANWPALKRLDGFFDIDVVKARVIKIKEQLGPLAQIMSTETKADQEAKAKCERIQKKGILVTQEMDLHQDPAFRRLMELKDITVDPYLFQKLLAREGLHIVAVFERSGTQICGKPDGSELTEKEEEKRRFNDYITYKDRVRTNLIPSAGGRINSELMSDVMRPREGRSPSPLGTWY